MVADVSEEELPDHGASEGDRSDIALCRRAIVCIAVDFGQDGVNLTDDAADRIVCD